MPELLNSLRHPGATSGTWCFSPMSREAAVPRQPCGEAWADSTQKWMKERTEIQINKLKKPQTLKPLQYSYCCVWGCFRAASASPQEGASATTGPSQKEREPWETPSPLLASHSPSFSGLPPHCCLLDHHRSFHFKVLQVFFYLLIITEEYGFKCTARWSIARCCQGGMCIHLPPPPSSPTHGCWQLSELFLYANSIS